MLMMLPFASILAYLEKVEYSCVMQVAQIYQSIEFSRLTTLVPFVDAFQLERAIVDAARHCDLQVSTIAELFGLFKHIVL